MLSGPEAVQALLFLLFLPALLLYLVPGCDVKVEEVG